MAEETVYNVEGDAKKQIQDIGKATKKTTKQLEAAKKATEKYKNENEKLKKKLKEVTDKMGIFGTKTQRNAMTLSVFRSKLLMFNFTMAITVGKIMNFVKAAGEQERATKAVSAAIISTGGAAGVTTSEIIALSDELERNVGLASKLVLESSALLLTFTQIGENVFPRAQESIVDVTAAMYRGNITAESLKTTTIQVGKALNDPIKGMTALQRVGIQFDHTQKRQIAKFVHTSQIAKAQGVILGELEKQFGDMGEEIKETTEGKLLAFNTALGNLSREIGESLKPFVDSLIVSLTELTDSLSPQSIARYTTSLAGAFLITKTGISILRNYKAMQIAVNAAQIKTTLSTLTLTTALRALFLGPFGLLVGTGILTAFLSKLGKSTNVFAENSDAVKLGSTNLEEYNVEMSKLSKSELENQQTVLKTKSDIHKKEYERLKDEIEWGKQKVNVGGRATNLTKEQTKELEKQMDTQAALYRDATQQLVVVEKKLSEEGAGESSKLKESEAVFKVRKSLEAKLETLKRIAEWQKLGNEEVHLSKKAQSDLLQIAKRLNLEYEDLFGTEEGDKFLNKLVELVAETDNLARAQKQMWETINTSIDAGVSLLGDFSRNRIQQSKKEEALELKTIKKTSQYKIAQRRGDEKTMERLENEAKQRHIKNQQDEFRFNQKLAAGKIIIDFLVAMAKEYGMKGIFGGIVANKWLAIQSAVKVGAVMAQPMPQYAEGGDFITQGPQPILVGDNPGGRERVQITPLSSPNISGPQGGSVNITFNSPIMSEDYTEDVIIPQIKESLRRGEDIGLS